MQQPLQKVVAIDGPAGSGKSSVAKAVANRLKALYIDTGAMYRLLGWYANNVGIYVEDEKRVCQMLGDIKFEYGLAPDYLVGVDGKNLTNAIREPYVATLASQISKWPCIRDYLTIKQRELVQNQLCVMEGRDIGTVVFPQAFLKIFLDADVKVRTQRRQDQLAEKNQQIDFDVLLKDMIERDKRDSEREHAPLKQADDAIYLDTTALNFDQVVDEICNLVVKRRKIQNI